MGALGLSDGCSARLLGGSQGSFVDGSWVTIGSSWEGSWKASVREALEAPGKILAGVLRSSRTRVPSLSLDFYDLDALFVFRPEIGIIPI